MEMWSARQVGCPAAALAGGAAGVRAGQLPAGPDRTTSEPVQMFDAPRAALVEASKSSGGDTGDRSLPMLFAEGLLEAEALLQMLSRLIASPEAGSC